MTIIGIITRGKYGKRLIETVLERTSLGVVHTAVPEKLPGFIDDPEEFLGELALDNAVFGTDIMITYSLHPDLTAAIAERAGKNGVRALIVPGGAAKAPIRELEQISGKYGMYIEVEDICCTLSDNPAIYEFSSELASPVLNIETDNGKVSDVKVIRGAPCGSTWQMAKELIGTKIEDAPARAGLLIQQYPCRAVRGTLGGIHQSAEIHKTAVEKALLSKQKKED
ncbi:DUF166 domain-containing protein [Methanolobus sp.]|uniref:DUF166 domain-containing protein n=1 Tax=Methanolobus sp. TaxID=1874737 RepID=UPI0025ED291D|nr:DUF166 domain-containing protein [Methanolobus sp.]